jgi:iron complex transport system substrate-binding protein
MLRRLRCTALLFTALAHSLSLSAAEVTDDRGVPVVLATRPVRIIALAPSLAEIAYAAGAGAQLIAGVRFTDYPDAAARLPQVGDASRLDIERILALEPDLLLGWKSGNPAGDLRRLEALGLLLFVAEPRRLHDIARLLRTIGELAATRGTAESAASALERELAALRARYGARREVRVFYEIWHRPLLTINGEHLISDVITLCGGRNVFAGAPVLTPSVSHEAVLAAAPQVVLGGSSAIRPDGLITEWRSAPVAALRALPVRYVPPDLIQRQTPRVLEGAKVICAHLEEIREKSVRKR